MQKKLLNAADCPLSFLEYCLEKAETGQRKRRIKEIIKFNYPKKND